MAIAATLVMALGAVDMRAAVLVRDGGAVRRP